MPSYDLTKDVYEFYRNRKVIVTGASGFLGRHVVQFLDSLKTEVIPITSSTVDLRNEKMTFEYWRWMDNNFAFEEDETLLIHLAAIISGIHNTAKNPLTHLRDNVLMTTNVMGASSLYGINNIVLASSVCAYPELTPCPMVEENLWEGKPEPTNFAYGESKRYAMSLVNAYYQQGHFANYASLISANLYGPYDHFDPRISHVIPALIMKIQSCIETGEPLEVWGTGRASRDFLYVEDAALAYVLAGYQLFNTDSPIVANIGSGNEVTISFLAQELARLMSFNGQIVYDKSKPDGQKRRSLSIYKAISSLKWRPHTDLEEGLRRTIKWYKEAILPAQNSQYYYSHQINTRT